MNIDGLKAYQILYLVRMVLFRVFKFPCYNMYKEFDYYKFTVGPGQGVYINYKFTEEKIRELLTHI